MPTSFMDGPQPTLPNVEIAPLEPLNASLESSNIFHLTFLASGFYNIIMCTTICPVLLPFTNHYAFIKKKYNKIKQSMIFDAYLLSST